MWIAFGLLGQGLFTSRFLVQWLSSERQKRSVIPNSFWYFSIGGSLILLTYAVHRADPVFGIGQAAGLLIYARNLQLIRNAGQKEEADSAGQQTSIRLSVPPHESEVV